MLDLRAGILEIVADEQVADVRGDLQRRGGLRHHGFPVLAIGPADVDGDDAAARGVEVGVEVEDRPVVGDELVHGVEVVDQVDRQPKRLVQVLVGDRGSCGWSCRPLRR